MKIDVISTLKAVIEGSIEGAAAGFILSMGLVLAVVVLYFLMLLL